MWLMGLWRSIFSSSRLGAGSDSSKPLSFPSRGRTDLAFFTTFVADKPYDCALLHIPGGKMSSRMAIQDNSISTRTVQ
jgi:hypothetical protein